MSSVDVIVLRAFQLDGARQEVGARLSLSAALAAELASAGKVAPAPAVERPVTMVDVHQHVAELQAQTEHPLRSPPPARRYTPRPKPSDLTPEN